MRRLFNWAFEKGTKHDLETLKKVMLFKGLNRNLLVKLLIDLIPKDYMAGETIFSEGDNGKALYIVMKGSVEIIKNTGSGQKTLARLEPGSYFGELALINHTPRFATAVASENTNLIIMYKAYFDDLIKSNSTISSRILLNLVESLSDYICKNQVNEQGNDKSSDIKYN